MAPRGLRTALTALLAAALAVAAVGWVTRQAETDFGSQRQRIGSHAFMARAQGALDAGANRLVGRPCPASAHGTTVSAAQRQSDMDALQLPTWRSGDVAVTTALSDGRVLWMFGDTGRVKGAVPRMVGNSMLVSTGRCFQELSTPDRGPVIGGFGERRACWPNSAVTVPVKGADLVVVGCSRVDRGRGGLLDFTYAGLTMATFVVRPGGAPQLVSQVDVHPDDANQQQVNWGAALVAHDGWVYVYGSQQPKGSFGKGAYVARAHVADLLDTDRWHYWNGSAFVAGVSHARPFIGAGQGVSQTFSVAPWRGRYLLVSKQGGEFGANIGVWSAPTPTGPWTGLEAVPRAFDQGGGVVAYQPLAHPELPTPSGNLLVTMSRTTTRFSDLLTHPERGRPMFLEIPTN